MRNRYLVLTVLVAAALGTLSGCAFLAEPTDEYSGTNGDMAAPDNGSAADDPGVEQDPGAEHDPGVGQDPDEPGSEEPCCPQPDPAPAPYPGGGPLAYFGQTMEAIKAELGEPDEQDYVAGSEFFFYEKERIYLFFWAVPDGETMVRGINLLEGKAVAGVQIGNSVGQIKKVLGEPYHQGYSEFDNTYDLIYNYDQFRLFFNADSEDGPTRSVLIKYLDEC